MKFAKDFRTEARNSLSNNWGKAIGAGLLATLFGAVTTGLGSGGGSSYEDGSGVTVDFSGLETTGDEMLFLGITFGFVLIALFMTLVFQLLVGGPVTLGYAKFNLNLVDRKQAGVSDLFSEFGRFGQAVLLKLLRGLFVFLWSLLFVIPGIIAGYSYSMAHYIMLENPNMTATEAIAQSKELMDGNKWRLFCLGFSFIGWGLLCGLTPFGLGYLWLLPYQEASYAAFYREIKREKYGYTTSEYDDFTELPKEYETT